MKKLFVSLALGAVAAGTATSAIAAEACTGAAGNGTAVTGATDGSLFVRVGFTPKCSANVLAQYTDQTTSFAVAAGSSKGKNAFIGNTAGGAVKPGAACPTSGCDSGAVGTALTAAEAMAGSS